MNEGGKTFIFEANETIKKCEEIINISYISDINSYKWNINIEEKTIRDENNSVIMDASLWEDEDIETFYSNARFVVDAKKHYSALAYALKDSINTLKKIYVGCNNQPIKT